ncbi:MAG: hypothetical protein JSU63_19095 [Phycisphaerales bacterium]|nr:MAG: hypothetical protein JSU63_19095 [Phycisphaerales bacterium]
MKCPNCHSSEHNHVVMSLRNIGVTVFNTVLLAAQIVVVHHFWEGLALRRKCVKCGFRFVGPRRELPDFDECAQREYNLTGKVSGRCPECGWKLPRRYRMYRRKADKKLKRD